MNRPTLLLVTLLTLTGGTALWFSLRSVSLWLGPSEALVLILAMALELLKVDLFTYKHTERSAVTLGLAATFLVLALYGSEAAVLVALLQALVTALVNRSVWFKAMFNAGLFTTATFLAGWVYDQGARSSSWEAYAVLAAFAAASGYFLVQSLCVTAAISLSSGRPFRRVWSDSFGWMMLQQAVTGMVGLLLGRLMLTGMTFVGVVMLGSPLVLLRYSYRIFAQKTQEHVHQIEEANAALAHLNRELLTTNDELIQTLGSLLDARDRYTFGHSAQVATYAVALGTKLHLSPPELERLRQAALLHDIGKVGIPESILYKDGPLNQYELRIMQAHAEIGYRIVSQIHSLTGVAEIIRQHHEWYAGGGYPRNLRGEEILLEARIIAVADALDTIASDRPYRRGKPVEVAFSEIRRCAGTQFDPAVVTALEQMLRERGGLWFENPSRKTVHTAMALEVAAAMSEASDPVK